MLVFYLKKKLQTRSRKNFLSTKYQLALTRKVCVLRINSKNNYNLMITSDTFISFSSIVLFIFFLRKELKEVFWFPFPNI